MFMCLLFLFPAWKYYQEMQQLRETLLWTENRGDGRHTEAECAEGKGVFFRVIIM